jgi:hypothetical protein
LAIRNEYPDKFNWWLNELESLGVSAKILNDLNDNQEMSELTENLKQTLIRTINLPIYQIETKFLTLS